MNYYATRPYKKQRKHLNNSIVVKKPETLLEKCQALSPLERKIANCLLSKANECAKVFLGRPYLANYGGCSTRTVTSILARLKEIGLISWESRHYHSHLFSFHPLASDLSFRSQASFLFKSLVCMPFALSYFMLASSSPVQENISVSVFSSREILRNYIYIITEPKPNSGRIRTYERAREADFGPIFKKEIDMNEFKRQGSIIPDSIKKCGLHLTAIGEADLARYPDEAIKHALDQLKLASDVSDPYRYVCKIANNWCKAKNIQPDHEFSGKHFQLLQAEISSPRLIDTDLSDLIGVRPKRAQNKPNELNVKKLHPEYNEPERELTEKDRDFYDRIEWDESTHKAMAALGIPLEVMKRCVSNIKKQFDVSEK